MGIWQRANMTVVLSNAAVADIERQSRWYFQQAGRRVAERYMTAFDDALVLLKMQPGIGVGRRFRDQRLKGLRSLVLSGAFRVHLVFYRWESDQLIIFRVIHGMRDLPRRLLEPPE